MKSTTHPRHIATEADVVAALGSAKFLLFKHSPICPVSAAAFDEYELFAAKHPDVPTAWIDVIGSRPLARFVAETTGVRHESPQAIWIRGGRVAWHASHGAITRNSLADAAGVNG